MTITKEEAIQKAINLLSSSIDESRLEIVDHISGAIYGVSESDIENSWIIFVEPERFPSDGLILDGPQRYILVDKNTGIINEIIAR
jgi:hypothetical protein